MVLPYLDATQSGVVPIALAHGNPIIASNTGGLHEQLDNGKVGLFCDSGNVESLVELMKSFLENPNLFEIESKKSKIYSETLDWDNAVSELLDNLNVK